MMRSFLSKKVFIPAALLLLMLSAAWAQPNVQKVEPPNWWIGMPHDPMLLLTGEKLEQAKVTTHTAGVQVLRTQPGSGGHSLFVWIKISPRAAAGNAQFEVATPQGTTHVSLPLRHRERVAETGKGVHADDVVYLIMPDRFANGDTANDDPAAARGHFDRASPRDYHGGDLKGVEQHLGYLKELGVTTLWFTPWWKNSSTSADYHGYHVTDFYAVDDHFGSLADLQQMVRAAHAQGIKVVSDYVGNHIGPESPWAQQPPLPSWLHGSVAKHMDPKYDFWPLVDVHSVARDRRPVVEGWFAGRLPDLNPDDPLLCEFLADNAIWWMESAHLDGYRLDTFPYSSRQFWGNWHKTLRTVYPQVTSVGEVFNFDPVITSFYEGGRTMHGIDSGVTTVFDFPFYSVLRDVLLHGQPATKLVNVLQHDYLYQRPGGLYTFFGNHDVSRFMGEPGATPQKLNAAFSLLFTMRGIPQLYSGDEIAMPGGDDPDNRRDFPGGFPGDTHNAFTAAGRTPVEQQVFTHVQQLARLRHDHPALQSGELRNIAYAESYYVYLRQQGEDRILVVFNSAASEQKIDVEMADTPLQGVHAAEPLLDAPKPQLGTDKITVSVPAMSVATYRLQ